MDLHPAQIIGTVGPVTPIQNECSASTSRGNQSMKRLLSTATILLAVAFQPGIAQTPAPAPATRGAATGRGAPPPPIQAKPEELAKIKEKTEQIEALVKDLKAKRAAPEMVGDVEVYSHAGQMLLEYPDMFAN